MKRLLCGWRAALIVCQAMSIAMTVVLPAPVASLSAKRISSGLASLLALARWSKNPLPRLPTLRRNLGQPNRGLDGLDLAEERTDAAEIVMPPMLEQSRGFRCYLPVTRIWHFPPLINLDSEAH